MLLVSCHSFRIERMRDSEEALTGFGSHSHFEASTHTQSDTELFFASYCD